MKWIAKRIFLNTHRDMDIALIQFVTPFKDMVQKEISNWYCSRKTEDDGTKPSVRIYLYIDKKMEDEIISKLFKLLREKKDIIGWTEEYIDEQTPDPSKENLETIRIACEIALKLMKDYPEVDRNNNQQFLVDLKKEVNQFLDSMNTEYDWEAIHFIANNLGLRDEFIIRLASV